MGNETKRKIDWFHILGLIWFAAGILCLCPAGMFIIFYDSPLGESIGILDQLLIVGVISFPVICILSSLGIRLLKDKSKTGAIYASLLPVIPLTIIFAIYSLSGSSSGSPVLKDQGDSTQLSECALPVPDGGDGLMTTGCGTLVIRMVGTGRLENTSEAHNWDFSSPGGAPVTITIENDGQACVQMNILDASGATAPGFADADRPAICPNGMITTSFFAFDPSDGEIYTLRLSAPETPGTYWVTIK
ncbi:MAG: hypothetical protein HXY35_12265 [Chloroflexi bacterium]|nr:hypothetical protein [Chloroflexota bacterium]